MSTFTLMEENADFAMLCKPMGSWKAHVEYITRCDSLSFQH